MVRYPKCTHYQKVHAVYPQQEGNGKWIRHGAASQILWELLFVTIYNAPVHPHSTKNKLLPLIEWYAGFSHVSSCMCRSFCSIENVGNHWEAALSLVTSLATAAIGGRGAFFFWFSKVPKGAYKCLFVPHCTFDSFVQLLKWIHHITAFDAGLFFTTSAIVSCCCGTAHCREVFELLCCWIKPTNGLDSITCR